jgi:hypothetical protein
VLGNAGSRREWAFSLALGAFALWVLGGAGIDLMTTLSA